MCLIEVTLVPGVPVEAFVKHLLPRKYQNPDRSVKLKLNLRS